MDNIAFERHQVGFKVTIRNSGICLYIRNNTGTVLLLALFR